MLSFKKVKISDLKKLSNAQILKLADNFDDAKEKSMNEYYRREEKRLSKITNDPDYFSRSEDVKRK